MKSAAPVRQRAFTLIELLAVIGVIVLLVGGIGLALSDPGATSLANAQNTLAALAGTARAQAAVRQTEARLLIYATRPPNGDSEKYLRTLRVVVAATPGSTGPGAIWTAVGAPVSLPRGICVVPAATAGLIASGVTWPTNPAPVSTLLTPAAAYAITGEPATSPTPTYFALEFSPSGTVNPAAAKLAVSPAAVANSLPAFNNPGAVRGLLLRTSGAITFVNDAASF
jgi:prepilin-type N-terminal cleavage/methylation domain-containing protein